MHAPSARQTLGWLALVAVCLASCKKSPASVPIAQLVVAEGSVTLVRGDQTLPGVAPTDLFSGDVLMTGEGATAKLRFSDGKEATISEKTRFRLGEQQGKLTLLLEEGTIITHARSQGGGAAGLVLSLLTSSGEVRIVEGTELRFDVRGDRSTMKVLLGESTVLGPDGKPLKVVAGDMLDLVLKRLEKPKALAEPLALSIRAERGRPLVRASSQDAFASLSTTVTTMPVGAAFRIPNNAEAMVTSASARIALLGGMVGELSEALRAENLERYTLALEAGELHVDFPREGLRNVRVGRMAFGAKDAFSTRVALTQESHFMDVRLGTLEISSEAGPTVVKAGSRAMLSAQTVSVSPSPSPLLALPFVKNVKVYTDALSEVALELPPGEGERRVEIARDSSFQELIAAGKTEQSFVVSRAPPQGALFWRVAGGSEELFGHAQFDQEKGRSAIGRRSPRAEVAESGLKATVIFQSAAPSLTFTYAAREGAASYRIQVFREGELSAPVVESTSKELSCSFPAGALREGNYVWFAAGFSANGAELSGGRMNKLSLIYDNSRRTLAITKPLPGAKSRSATLQTSGVAPLGSKVFVNGMSAPLDRKGRFTLAVPRAESLIFRLVSRSGEEEFWVRRMRGGP